MILGIIKSVVKWGPVAVREGDNYAARANLMMASTLAMNGLIGVGHDQNWVSHMMEHAISAVWIDVAHGAGMALMIPAYIKLLAPHDTAGKLAYFAKSVFGAEDASEALRSFFAEIGLPMTLAGLVGKEPTEEEMQLVLSKALPWGTMEVGGYPPFTPEDAAAAFRLVM